MKSVIRRTSGWFEKPCEECKKEIVGRYHIRTCSEEVFNKRFSFNELLWRDKGYDHCVTKEGYIQRTEDSEEWVADIDLIEFSKKYGSIILSCDEFIIPSVEIYDDYRE